MNLLFLVARGFTQSEVYAMTLRQTILLSKAGNKLLKFERLALIKDRQVSGQGIDEMDFNRHINSLKYDE